MPAGEGRLQAQDRVISRGNELAHEVMPRVHKAPRFSSDGLPALIRAAFSVATSTITSTSSPSGSIVGTQRQGACSSTDSRSRLSQSTRRHIATSSKTKNPTKLALGQ